MTVSSVNPQTLSNALAAATAAVPKASAAATAATAATGTTGNSPATTDTATNPSSVLNQADFLQLLVAQIQYQDPMNPQSDTDMAAQMAQFTSLQQATQSSASLAMIQANSLVGSTVQVQVDATNTASGVVTGVVLNSGTPQVTVGGTNYGLSQITSITPAAAAAAGATTSGTTSGTTTSGTSTTP
jgi:flagellar basal-body rod modification protein FlgD